MLLLLQSQPGLLPRIWTHVVGAVSRLMFVGVLTVTLMANGPATRYGEMPGKPRNAVRVSLTII